MLRTLRYLLIGRPLHNRQAAHERLPKWKALAIFSSDALSSVGYGPEQVILTLAASGLLVYGYFQDILLAVLALLAVVTLSYVQVSRANAGGGGSYAVAKANLGEYPALIAASALFADYVLTVAVSVSSGTDALVSAFPSFIPWSVTIDVLVLFGILMLVNLRGVRESSNVFVLPTYLFIFGILALIVAGLYSALTGTQPVVPPESMVKQELDLTVIVLILRAFANGCSSMTGVEAISNGVPMFKAPQTENAIRTTYWMSGMLAAMLAGLSFLMIHYHVTPIENVTMLSQIAEETFGRGWLYYYIQLTTMLILYLAANTAFNGLPPLMSLLARDGYMPRYLSSLGDRLSYSNGIILLTVIAALLIVQFEGNVEHLISLYAIGVFLSFTLAQAGLVLHWRKERSKGWLHRAALNGFGAIVTGIVVLVVAITKFTYGAWVVLIFIPIMVYCFKKVNSHYADLAEQLHLPKEEAKYRQPLEGRNIVIVTVASPTRAVAETMRYARKIGDEVIALHVATDESTKERVEKKWLEWDPGVHLVTVYSPYRMVLHRIVAYIKILEKQKNPEDYITVVIPEFETRKWWHRLLHNQTGWLLRTMLILEKDVVVATVPYQLKK